MKYVAYSKDVFGVLSEHVKEHPDLVLKMVERLRALAEGAEPDHRFLGICNDMRSLLGDRELCWVCFCVFHELGYKNVADPLGTYGDFDDLWIDYDHKAVGTERRALCAAMADLLAKELSLAELAVKGEACS